MEKISMKNQETKEKFVELRAKGLSFDRIAAELETSKQTLINWAKELENEISNLKKVELEALQEKYFMLKSQRIELFGEKLKAIKDELDKRNLSDLPTDKLFDLFMKCFHQLNEESVDIVFHGEKQLLEEADFRVQTSWKG
jgi:hypothetical protein